MTKFSFVIMPRYLNASPPGVFSGDVHVISLFLYQLAGFSSCSEFSLAPPVFSSSFAVSLALSRFLSLLRVFSSSSAFSLAPPVFSSSSAFSLAPPRFSSSSGFLYVVSGFYREKVW